MPLFWENNIRLSLNQKTGSVFNLLLRCHTVESFSSFHGCQVLEMMPGGIFALSSGLRTVDSSNYAPQAPIRTLAEVYERFKDSLTGCPNIFFGFYTVCLVVKKSVWQSIRDCLINWSLGLTRWAHCQMLPSAVSWLIKQTLTERTYLFILRSRSFGRSEKLNESTEWIHFGEHEWLNYIAHPIQKYHNSKIFIFGKEWALVYAKVRPHEDDQFVQLGWSA